MHNKAQRMVLTTRSPAICALLVQLLALGISMVAYWFALQLTDLPLLILFVLQALVAVMLSGLIRQPSWWYGMHAAFPILTWLLLTWTLPVQVYAVGFMLCAGFHWAAWHSRVPYYPSSDAVHQHLQQQIPETSQLRVLDIGSGLGGVLLALAAARPNAQFYGVEISPIPWCISRFRAALSSSNIQFAFKNYRQCNLGHYDLVYAYLSPAVMPSLWLQASAQMRPGSLLISYEFMIPEQPATHILNTASGKPLYIWRM